MTDQEFDLLEELYFIQDYSELLQTLGWSEEQLTASLINAIDKGWVKCVSRIDGHEPPLPNPANFSAQTFLATKAGLFAHNTR